MDLIFLTLCTLCIVVIFAFLPKLHHYYVIRQKLKSLPTPVIGSIFKLMRLSDYERLKLFLTIMENCKEGIFVQYIGATPNINIFKPEYLEHIFPSTVNITKGDFYDMLKPWLGNGLLTSTDEQWFHDRKLIGPTFHFNILDQFAGIMFEKAEILTKCLQKEIEKEPGKAVNIFPFIINAALDIICETAMGVDVHAQEVVTKYTSTVHLLVFKILILLLYCPTSFSNRV